MPIARTKNFPSYNVDGVVGTQPAENSVRILLVQFCFAEIARKPFAEATAQVLAEAKLIKTTGFIDQPTINAIRGLQSRKTGGVG